MINHLLILRCLNAKFFFFDGRVGLIKMSLCDCHIGCVELLVCKNVDGVCETYVIKFPEREVIRSCVNTAANSLMVELN